LGNAENEKLNNMNILGINGLGIAPSACLVQDGALTAMAEEERFNRFKGSFGFMPEKSVRFCLDFKNITLDDIDYIAFSWDSNSYRFYMPCFFIYSYIRHAPKFRNSSNIFKSIEQLLKYHPNNTVNLLAEMFYSAGCKGDMPPVVFVPHHVAHAASSFYISGFDEAYIVVIDGSGEDKCTTIMRGNGLDIETVRVFKIPNSLGWFYQSITEFLGFMPNRHEGKVMALAPYGNEDQDTRKKINRMILQDHFGGYKYSAKYSFLGRQSGSKVYSDAMRILLGPARNYGETISDSHKNIAYYAQEALETAACNIVKNISCFPDYNGKLCISGGVGLNCKMNGVIAEMDCIKEIYVPPFPNDAGTSLGAALYVARKKGFNPRCKVEHPYWGPDFSSDNIEKVLIKCGAMFSRDPLIEKTVADLIYKDKIIGWFQGRMEAGPRALGNRSILANPTKAWISDHVNRRVKNREAWRPFAPSILHEEKDKYLIDAREAPFMSISFKVSEKIKHQIPAVVHIDSSTRPHLVKKDINPRYWKVIDEFRKKSGIAVVLNTSFNADEEPIVCTPEEAIKTFHSSGMDYLAIENFIVHK
jgi:carbamoyltransferase